MKMDGVNFSHTYIKLTNDNLKNDLYYHASGLAVNFMTEAMFNNKNEIIEEYSFDISPKAYYKTLDFAISKVGSRYSTSQLVGLGLVKLAALFGKKINNPFGKKGYVCTELVGELLKEIYGKKITKQLNSLSLKDINQLIKNTW